MKTIAIIGATGAVGQQMLECLEERDIQAKIQLYASKKSQGKKFKYKNQELICQTLTKDSFKEIDYALGATSNEITKTWMPWAKEHNVIVIDNSSAYRMDANTPLVIPEINQDDIQNHQGIIANPNCATILALMAIYPLHQAWNIQRMIVTTFQAVSGAGVQGIQDLKNQIQDPSTPSKAFAYPIAYNVIPQIGEFNDLGITKEEEKLEKESKKILHNEQLRINCTCVRVPVLRCHCESITIECEKEVDVQKAKHLLQNAKGVVLKDDCTNNIYPMPIIASNQDLVHVGRIRKDPSDPSGHSLSLFCCGDQIRKGAATNAIQILEALQ